MTSTNIYRYPNRLYKISNHILSPIESNLLFFILTTLFGCVSPLVYSFSHNARIIWLILFAAVQSATISYLLCLLIHTIKTTKIKIEIKAICLILSGISAIIETGSIIFTGEPIGPDSLGLVIETNLKEIRGFATQYISNSGLFLIAAVLAACCVTSFLFRSIIHKIPSKSVIRLFTAAIILFTLCFGTVRIGSLMKGMFITDFQKFLVWMSQDPGNPVLIRTTQFKFADPLLKWIYLIKDQNIQRANISKWEETQRRVLSSPCKARPGHDFNIVVIIGESFILSHSSLYGYPLQTNPRLEEERDKGQLKMLQDMITTANYTTTSLRNLLNLNDLSAKEDWYSAPYFPLLVKQAGWEVYHFDNQTISASSDIGIGRMIFSPLNLQYTYDGLSDSIFTYDGDFTDYVNRRLSNIKSNGKKLVTYHLWGQHFNCRDRFPGLPHFSSTDITVDRPWLNNERRQEIANYDSATYYNDSVVGNIIDFWRDTPTILFYFSDHGEDCWDLAPISTRNHPHPEDRNWLERQYRIPFIIWISDQFQEKYPQLTNRIDSSRNLPGMLDNFGQIILGICGIDTPYYRPTRDILAPEYQFYPRVTSEGYSFD